MDNSTDNKQKILATALQLFSEKGYDAVGVQLIAEKSEITKPTLYYYFGSKEGVFKDLLQLHYSRLNKQIAESAVYKPDIKSYYNDVYPVLIKVVKTYFNFAAKNDKFYRMVLSALFSPPTSQTVTVIREFHNQQYEIINEMFTQMANSHKNMKGKEKRLCWTFIGMINTYIGLWYNQLETLSEETTKEAVNQFMHGIFN